MGLLALLSVAFFIALLICTYNEKAFGSLLSMVGFVCGLQFLCNFDVFNTIRQKPMMLVSLLSLYLILGVAWGIIKWWVYVKRQLRKYKLKKSQSLHFGHTEEEFTRKYPAKDYKPQISDNKERWMNWVVCWPMSILIYLCGDLLVDLFQHLYETFAKLLQSISDNVWKEVEDK